MIRLLHAQLDNAASRRGPGFIEALMSRAVDHGTHVEIEREAMEALNREWPVTGVTPVTSSKPTPDKSPAAPKIQPRWPMNPFGIAMRALKLMRTPEDTGAGDTLARVVGPIGGDAYKAWFKETFGKTCGCAERQEQLNAQFPYE